MSQKFTLESCLATQEKYIPRRNLAEFLAYKTEIFEALKDYSLKQIWLELNKKGKFSGSYNAFTYYFRKYRNKTVEHEEQNGIPESPLPIEKKSIPTSREETQKKEASGNGQRPFTFEIPRVPEEEL